MTPTYFKSRIEKYVIYFNLKIVLIKSEFVFLIDSVKNIYLYNYGELKDTLVYNISKANRQV